MKVLVLISTILFSSAYAKTKYYGLTRSHQETCSLTVYDVGVDENGRPYAEVAVSASDDDHLVSEEFSFTVHPGVRSDLLSGQGTNGKDRLNIMVEEEDEFIESPKAYALKWLHGNHYHNILCLNLVRE